MIEVEVVFALPDRQWILPIRLIAGSTVESAIAASGLCLQIEGLCVDDNNIGVFSRPAKMSTALADGDRVEVYRPLTRDPMDTRRLRARQQKKKQK